MTYHHSWLYLLTLTYDHHLELWLMTYDLWLVTYEYDYHLCLWPSPITSDYHLPPITVAHVLSITMTYHIWALLMTIIYDYHPWLLHMSITCDYDLITHDYVHHPWTSLMDITYEHQVLCLMPYTLWLITCEYHTRLLPMTIIHDYVHLRWLCLSHDLPQLTMTITNEHDYHPWTWLPPMTMNITHNLSPLMTSSHHSWSITSPMTSSHHSWLSPLCVTYDCHRCLITRVDHFSPMTLITQDHHSWPSPKTITNDHDYHLPLMTMTSYFWLTPMSSLLCLSLMSMTYDHHDYDYDLSLVTITSDHHPWPSSMTIRSDHLISHPWLLTHDHDCHPWGWHTTYDHDFSSMTMTSYLWPRSPMTMKCHQRPSGHSPMTIRTVTDVHSLSLLWSAHMDCLMGEYDVHRDRHILCGWHIHFDRLIHCAWGEYEYERVRVCESGVWYPLIKMTEMTETTEITKEGQGRLWWYFLNIVCFLVFLRIGVCVWVLSGVYLVCVLSGVGGWYKRCRVGKWVAPAILGD